MRTIKFRVWDNALKIYRSEKDGDYSLGVMSGKVRGIYGEKFPQMEVEQFTGLLDKNGKEIYEGDIIKGETRNFTVKFEEGMFTTDVGKYILNGDYEIIGNIHENVELL